jgi:hypothetical protein
MAKSGEWGDHVTLQAAPDKFVAKICLLTSFRDTCFVEIIPQSEAPQRGNYFNRVKAFITSWIKAKATCLLTP